MESFDLLHHRGKRIKTMFKIINLKTMKKYFLIIAVIAISTGALLKTQIQSRTITGIVFLKDDGSTLPGINVMVEGTTIGTTTNINGYYRIEVPKGKEILLFSFIGMKTQKVKIKGRSAINVYMSEGENALSEVVITSKELKKEKKDLGYAVAVLKGRISGVSVDKSRRLQKMEYSKSYDASYMPMPSVVDNYENHNTEEYATINENSFLAPNKNPLSTFSIDVDAASYSNIRRFLNNGQAPPKDAVRIEEMVNYFNYDYAQPKGEDPFSINTEIGECPWNSKHKLVHIGLQGKKIATENLPASNLVFLLDVSGSMGQPNKLPLLKSSLKMLVNQMRAKDRVAIVVYAGAAGLVLPSTAGNEKETIIAALDNLNAGGSTAGGAGIKLAYKIAMENFKETGNNRIILATDGDFNIGASSNGEMDRLIEEKRKGGVFLTVLGFGMGNYKDSKMESIADKGNGNYAYIDNIQEARKVLVTEFGGTLFAIAKDVKLQVEFNPKKVQAYRLIGYENRKLKNEDFNNDKKDAGELGSGHTVTAMYEIIPVGVDSEFIGSVDDLKYQDIKHVSKATKTNEILTLKLRYKQPEGTKSKLLVKTLIDETIKLNKTSNNFRFAAAVASFGMILRESEFQGDANISTVVALAKGAIGDDNEGYRAEFIKMVRSSDFMASR